MHFIMLDDGETYINLAQVSKVQWLDGRHGIRCLRVWSGPTSTDLYGQDARRCANAISQHEYDFTQITKG